MADSAEDQIPLPEILGYPVTPESPPQYAKLVAASHFDQRRACNESNEKSISQNASDSNAPLSRPIGMLTNFNENNRPRNHANSERDEDEHQAKRKARAPPQISPPPLKRYRVEPGTNRRCIRSTGQATKPIKLKERPVVKQNPLIVAPKGSQVEPQSLRTLNSVRPIGHNTSGAGSFVAPSSASNSKPKQQHEQDRQFSIFRRSSDYGCTREDDEVSLSSSVTRTSSNSGTVKCNQCKKSSVKKYDPLAKCQTCARHFHDGCRKPPLGNPAASSSWRCYRCVSKGRMPSTSSIELACGDFDRPLSAPIRVEGQQKDIWSEDTPQTQKRSSTAPLSLVIPSKRANDTSKLAGITTGEGIQAKDVTQSDPSELNNEPAKTPAISGSSERSLWRTRGSANENEGAIDAFQSIDTELNKLVAVSVVRKGSSTVVESHQTQPSMVIDRSETPNIPTQLFSGPAPEHFGANFRSNASEPVWQSDQNSSPITTGNSKPSRKLASTVLCTGCKRKRILAKKGDDNPMCRGCKQIRTGPNNETLLVTVPDTPELATDSLPKDSSAVSISEPGSAVSRQSEGDSPTSWFQRAITGSSKKIVTKKIRRGDFPTSLRQNTVGNTSQVDVSQKPDNTPTEGVQISQWQPPSQVKDVVDGTLEEESGSAAVHTVESEVDLLMPADVLLDKSIDDTSDLTSPPEDLTDSPMTSTNASAAGSPRSKMASLDECWEQTFVLKQKNYTFRELVGMALAAGEVALTTAEVQERIAHIFPNIQQKSRIWRKNINPILSQYDHFRKIPVSGEKSFKWTFENECFKEVYVKILQENSTGRPSQTSLEGTPPVTPTPRQKIVPPKQTFAVKERTQFVLQKTRPRSRLNITETLASDDEPNPLRDRACRNPQDQINSNDEAVAALTALLPESPLSRDGKKKKRRLEQVIGFLGKKQNHQKEAQASSDHERSRPKSLERKRAEPTCVEIAESIYMPFEKRPKSSLEYGPDVRVETDFLKAFPEYASSSIDSMTREEIDAKIAEIKERPKRKATFGQVLGSARLFRKDVHNELEGFHKPLPTVFDNNVRTRDENEEPETFKHPLDLPENIVPMLHEGQLAFRDATLVNGKLPRPRVVYKIGKRII